MTPVELQERAEPECPDLCKNIENSQWKDSIASSLVTFCVHSPISNVLTHKKACEQFVIVFSCYYPLMGIYSDIFQSALPDLSAYWLVYFQVICN